MTLLITTFAPWKAHQTTNSSDDLVASLYELRLLPTQTRLVRNLPVHFQLAPSQVIAAVYQHRPTTVICCGMAETRSRLNLERYAHGPGERFETPLNLSQLAAGLKWTTISHNAGNFVCNALYYELLRHIQKHDLGIQSLFLHVPLLNNYNRQPLIQDCVSVLSRLQTNKPLALLP
ncbi:MAG: peptidase C15 [Leptolyngbya sp. SIOISBB]|nr:peptidase C15 [Leptolyngbya sp. SIOISBB]